MLYMKSQMVLSLESTVVAVDLPRAVSMYLSTLSMTNHEQIKNLLAKKKKKVCWKCRRPNCLSMQICSRKFKLKKKFTGKCDGKPITFKQLKINKNVAEEKPSPKANESTAKITPPPTYGSDSDEDTDFIINNIVTNRSEEFGNNYYQNVAGFSVEGVITAEDLPDYDIMKETEFVADKSCIICQKENMNLYDLSAHYHDEHMIQFHDEYVDALQTWQEIALDFANEDKVVPQESYSSGEEQQISPSDYELYYGHPSKEKSQSESSSDSSSSKKSSRSRGNKKTKSKDSRDLESIRAQLKTQNSFNETKFKEMESFVEQTKQTTERILENQLKPNKEKFAFESSLLKIENTLTTIVKSSNAHQESIKSIEATMASTAKKEEENTKSIKNIEDAM